MFVAGGCYKRSSTLHNAYAKSVASASAPVEMLTEKLAARNALLQIRIGHCLWCGDDTRKITQDHLVPQCCRRDDVFGKNNPLNMVPACQPCNNYKSGKAPHLWLSILGSHRYTSWDAERVSALQSWIIAYRDDLYLSEVESKRIVDNLPQITRFSLFFEESALTGVSINSLVYSDKNLSLQRPDLFTKTMSPVTSLV